MVKRAWITKFAALRFFLQGCETYFIAPTAWYYIKSLGQTKFFLALVLCSYNFGSIIAGPLFGFLTDRFGHPKFLFSCCCALKVFSYMIYSINLNAYFPLIGRFMSGISSGDIAILMGQVALHTEEKDRGAEFVFLDGVYLLGSAFGPAMGSLLTFDINILGWEINDGNSPGIILVIILFIFFICSLFLPKEMWVETSPRHKLSISTPNDLNDETKVTNDFNAEGERTLATHGSKQKLNSVWDSRIICLFSLIFFSEVLSSTATFYAPILGLDHFHLDVIHIKLLFLNCTIFTLLMVVIFYLATDYVDERKLFLLSMFLQITAISFLTVLAFCWDKHTYFQYYVLLIYICLGMPYFGYPFGNSLLSKITEPSNTSFIQGLSYAAVHTAIVVSRVVLGFVFTKISIMCYSFILAFFWIVGFIWYGVLYKRMVPNE